MLYVKCLCWSLRHAEQLLFSGLCSKVSICNYVTCHISHVRCQMSYVICQMLMLILGTCWTTFVFMCKLKSEYLLLCHMSHDKCLCWSLRHAEKFLFSCLCSNVAIYGWKVQCLFFDITTNTLSCEWTNHRAGSQLIKRVNLQFSIKGNLKKNWLPKN